MNCVVKAHYFYTFSIQSVLFSLDVVAFFSLSFFSFRSFHSFALAIALTLLLLLFHFALCRLNFV